MVFYHQQQNVWIFMLNLHDFDEILKNYIQL